MSAEHEQLWQRLLEALERRGVSAGSGSTPAEIAADAQAKLGSTHVYKFVHGYLYKKRFGENEDALSDAEAAGLVAALVGPAATSPQRTASAPGHSVPFTYPKGSNPAAVAARRVLFESAMEANAQAAAPPAPGSNPPGDRPMWLSVLGLLVLYFSVVPAWIGGFGVVAALPIVIMSQLTVPKVTLFGQVTLGDALGLVGVLWILACFITCYFTFGLAFDLAFAFAGWMRMKSRRLISQFGADWGGRRIP